jgi:hypothetical protein
MRLAKFILLVSLLSAGLALAPADGNGQGKRRCGPAGAHTVKSNKYGRVFNRRGNVYACAYAGGQPHLLGEKYDCGSSSSCGGVSDVVLAGRWVGIAWFLEDQSSVISSVEVRRLRTGRTLHRRDSTDSNPGALVLRPNGSVGWLEVVPRLPTVPALTEVHRFDTTGHAVLDSGDDIHQLALHGAVMTWVNAGEEKSARLR